MEGQYAIGFGSHKGPVVCGSLNKSGQYAVTGGQDDKAYVWNALNGQLIIPATCDKKNIIFADFSHDDQYVATGDVNGLIQVRMTSDWSVVWENNKMGLTMWMQWHPLTHSIIAGSENGKLYMWEIPDGKCKILQSFGQEPNVCCIMPDGKRAVVGYNDGVIRLIDLKSCSVVSTFMSNIGHTSAITSIDCHLDNNFILSAGLDGKTIVSFASTGKIDSILDNLQENTVNKYDANWVQTIQFQKDKSKYIAASGTIFGDIVIWNVTTKVQQYKLNQDSGISKLVWKGTSTEFFTAGLDGILRCVDGSSGQCVQMFKGHVDGILDVYLSKDGRKALTVSGDRCAKIFIIE